MSEHETLLESACAMATFMGMVIIAVPFVLVSIALLPFFFLFEIVARWASGVKHGQ